MHIEIDISEQIQQPNYDSTLGFWRDNGARKSEIRGTNVSSITKVVSRINYGGIEKAVDLKLKVKREAGL